MSLENIPKDIGKAIDKVPEIYDDGLKKTVKESGDVVALIPWTIKAAIAPLRKWIAQKEYNVAETEKLLEQKLKNIDEEKIVRVILILLSNSIKFSKEKGDICVEMRREDEEVVIKVTDNGIGINEDMKEKIFDKFKRVQSVSNLNVDHEGSGLGLYIAKGFIELHNGSISVVSEVEKGSTFIITIPIVIIKNDLHNINHMDEDELNRIIKIELSDL